MFAHGETVVVQTAGAVTDPYSGDPATDWDSPTELEVPGCGIADGGSLEPLQDSRNAVESDFDVIMPPGTAVTSSDRLVVRGRVCEIVGRPFDWRNPFTGWTPGLIVRAKLREG